MVRIYDAAFAANDGTRHDHLAEFWWISNGQTGHWTREQAYDYVRTHDIGEVYTSEGGLRVNVRAYYNGPIHWIQTEADGQLKDNLTTLAERHRRGLPNN